MMSSVLVRVSAAVATMGIVARLAAGAPEPVSPQKNWLSIRTKNFYLIGDSGERNLRSVALRLEQFREALGVVLPKVIAGTSAPITVIVFRSHKAFEPFKPLYEGKARKLIAGYFQGGRAMNYIALTIEGSSDLGIIYHEYVHYVVRSVLSGVPVWFDEGTAEYYRTFEVSSNGRIASLGKVQPDHVYRLREQWLPLPVLLAVDHQSPHYNEDNRASVFYAESWALVHYLILGERQKYLRQAAEFVGRLADGESLEDACQKALKTTPAQLERELRAYVQQDGFPSTNFTFSERLASIERLPATPVTAAEAHATLGNLLLAMGRTTEAERQLNAAVADSADFAPAHASLGELHVEAGRMDQAREHLEHARTGSGASWRTHYMYATLLRQAGASGDPKTEQAIERALETSIELNPEFAESYAELAWVKMQQPASQPEALTLVEKALARSPGNERYVYLLASVLARGGEYAKARPLLDRLSRGAVDDWVRNASGDLLKRIEAFERESASSVRDDGRREPSQAVGSADYLAMFRKLAEGEERVAAMLTAIECTRGRVALALTVNGQPARVHVRRLDGIEFIAYRNDLEGQVKCGPRLAAEQVLVTYRPEKTPDDGTLGEAVAVEFPPADYRPN